MRDLAQQWRRAAAWASCLLSALALLPGATAVAQDARRVSGSLRDEASSWQRSPAPDSTWAPSQAESALRSNAPPSRFAPAAAPTSQWRLAEVPAERLAVTQQLLGELRARQTDTQAIVVELPADVLFDFDQARLRPDAQRAIDRAAELLRSYPDAAITVRGHTDAKGSDTYNDALSMRRAQAVLAALELDGSRRVQVEGHGRHHPAAPNTTPEGHDNPAGRQRNRRVEIVIEAGGR